MNVSHAGSVIYLQATSTAKINRRRNRGRGQEGLGTHHFVQSGGLAPGPSYPTGPACPGPKPQSFASNNPNCTAWLRQTVLNPRFQTSKLRYECIWAVCWQTAQANDHSRKMSKTISGAAYYSQDLLFLSVMSIESNLLEDVDFSDIVCSFAENKSRKKYI